jgi:ketosteroid isomerase-like protein
MIRTLLLMLASLLAALPAWAQSPEEAEHTALRKLKNDIGVAISKRDFAAASKLLHQPFMATVVTQESFTDIPQLKQYYDGLFTRHTPQIKDITIVPEADELSKIMTGTFAFTRGSTAEHYVLADGRAFDMKGRWTATSIKEPDGSWRILAIHTGINFLDNPVLDAIERSLLWIGAACAAAGTAFGLLGGWFIWRFRRRP